MPFRTEMVETLTRTPAPRRAGLVAHDPPDALCTLQSR